MDGFVLSGPFDDILRRLSAPWLAATWLQLQECLHGHGVDPGRLRWGGGHPAYAQGSAAVDNYSPLGVFGWVMPANRRLGESLWQQYAPHSLTELGERIERDFRQADVPLTVAGADIRGAHCTRVVDGVEVVPIPPSDHEVGLEVLVDHCDDAANWSPSMYNPWIPEHACGRIARAVAGRDNAAFLAGLEEARATYTPTGYRIVVLGFADIILGWLPDEWDAMEPRAGRTPVLVELGERLTVTFRSDSFRRPGWVTMGLDLDGVEGRWEPVHVDNVAACLDALRRQDAPARLTSLDHASELVFEPGTVRGHRTAYPDAGVVVFSVPVPAGALAGLTAALEGLTL